jgi:phosphomannomutase
MKSVSGIRGVIGETFTPDLVVQTAGAFAKYTSRGKIVLGRDTRPTGSAVSGILANSLSMFGCEVIDVGIVPTPTVQVMVEELGTDGGIIVSASHNPVEWNAFKLVSSTGSFLNEKQMKKFLRFLGSDYTGEKWNSFGRIYRMEDKSSEIHIAKVLSAVNIEKIKKFSFKVVLDSVNGAGSAITIKMLEMLGCRVTSINCSLNGDFSRGAEPVPENLTELKKTVLSENADIGFAQDPDADRLAVVDNEGNPIGEEYTITLVSEHLLSKKVGPVVVNLSTTRAVEDVARSHGAEFYRAKVGEINVVEKMRHVRARIGGEGNGGVISPEIHFGRDSLAGIAYILEMMAARKTTIAKIRSEIPSYHIIKGKARINDKNIERRIGKLKNIYKGEKQNYSDGFRIDFIRDKSFSGGWVHIRKSNTEPLMRIIAEGKTPEQASLIYRSFSQFIKM